jgi:hypothetical protein
MESGEDRRAIEAELQLARTERDRLVSSIAAGVDPATVAGPIREREASIRRLGDQLARAQDRDGDELRRALRHLVGDYRAQLRDAPEVARTLVRNLMDPITMGPESGPAPEWITRASLNFPGATS